MKNAILKYNISVAKAQSNLTNMIAQILAAKADTEVILMTMNPPINEHLKQRPKIEDFYQLYREVAKERKLFLIDQYLNWKPILKIRARWHSPRAGGLPPSDYARNFSSSWNQG